MENLQIYRNEKLGLDVRGLLIDGKPYFAGIDVATALGYANPSSTISKKCKHRTILDVTSPCQYGKVVVSRVNFISQGDVIRLICGSELPEAVKFEEWICDEVIPTILTNGSYSMEDNLQNENLLYEEDEVKFGIGSLEYYFSNIPSKDLMEQYRLCKKFYSIHRHRIIGKSIHETKVEIFDKIVEILDNRIKLTTNAQEKNRCYECITAILKDKNSSTNISNGKLIATKNRQIDRFETAFYNYKPPMDKLLQLPIHPISENIMYTTGYKISSNYDKKRKEFNEKVVPILPPLEYFGIDENTEEIVVWYGFNTVAPWVNKSGKSFDTTNLIKGIQDMIFDYYGLDDVTVKFCHALMESEYAERYEDGMIEFYMCPFKHMYTDEPVED